MATHKPFRSRIMINLTLRKRQLLGIDIVHGCQLRCIGCPNSLLQPKVQVMPVEDFDACLKNVDVAASRII